MILACGTDGSIGIDGGLIWRIPEDLRHFRALTTGHPVVMGRKTWESLPRRPLPGRLNIVMTRDSVMTRPEPWLSPRPKRLWRLRSGVSPDPPPS